MRAKFPVEISLPQLSWYGRQNDTLCGPHQTTFVKCMVISYHDDWYNVKYNFSLIACPGLPLLGLIAPLEQSQRAG